MKNGFVVFFALLLALSLLPAPAAVSAEEPQGPDYYQAGMETVAMMDEMVKSKDFILMLSGSDRTDGIRETVNTGDYGSPTAVYSVRLEDARSLVEKTYRAEDLERWNNLPDVLQEQLLKRVSVQSLCNIINGRTGTDQLAFASLVTAIVRNDSLPGGEPLSYLYFFEKGTPILVTFGYHGSSGIFLFLPEEVRAAPETLQGVLQEFGMDARPVEIR